MKRNLVIGTAGVFIADILAILVLSHYQHTSAVRPQNKFAAQIPQFHSTVDADKDGIDDQTDVLNGALAYVNSHP